MKKLFGGAAAVALLVGCASSVGPASDTTQIVASGDNRVVCRSMVVTGSNRKERLCATGAAWSEADAIQEQEAEELMARAGKRYTDTSGLREADRANGAN
jgi:hypothetical protein